MTEPGLGSGALREALELHEYRNGLCTCGQFVMPHYSYGDLVKFLETHPGRDIRWRYWLDHFSAALSLSSPIEPQCHELTDADAVECKNCGLGIGYWPSQPECARPTPQASSEIRERLQAILDSHPYEHEIAIEGYVRLQQQIAVVVGALAPSRQGAAKRVEG